jgi:AcrR family transcriptional regulator
LVTQPTKGERTRQRILAAAVEELLAGHGHIELAAVARRARISAGAPYRHFRSKADLLASLITDFYDRFDSAVFKPSFSEKGAWHAREVCRTRRFVEFFYDEPLAPVILTLMSGTSEVAASHRKHVERAINAATRNIERGQAESAIPRHVDATIAGAAVIGGLLHAVGSALTRHPRPTRKRLADELCRFVAASLSG